MQRELKKRSNGVKIPQQRFQTILKDSEVKEEAVCFALKWNSNLILLRLYLSNCIDLMSFSEVEGSQDFVVRQETLNHASVRVHIIFRSS